MEAEGDSGIGGGAGFQLPVNSPKGVTHPVATNQRDGQMAYHVDVAPGQNPHVNYEPSIHGGLKESSRPEPINGPTLTGRLTREDLERRNDYAQAQGRYVTMQDWERDDLVKNLGDLLGQCEEVLTMMDQPDPRYLKNGQPDPVADSIADGDGKE